MYGKYLQIRSLSHGHGNLCSKTFAIAEKNNSTSDPPILRCIWFIRREIFRQVCNGMPCDVMWWTHPKTNDMAAIHPDLTLHPLVNFYITIENHHVQWVNQ